LIQTFTKANKLFASAAIALAMLTTSGMSATAGESRMCEPFKAYSTGEFREVVRVDANEDDEFGPGDRLVGHRVLADKDGKKIGDRYFTGTIQAVDATGKGTERVTEVVNVFTNGSIYTTKLRHAGVDLPSVINGGIGDFKGIRGTVKVHREGTVNVYHFLPVCDQPEQS
jgi:hypothetical protein